MFLSVSDFVTLDFPRIAQDDRRVSNGKQVNRLAGLALKAKPSVDFGGYWQQHVEAAN
jgi:hypothetical protein